MNTQNFPDHDLSQHLARRADDFGRRGGSELEIGQVVARAGEIRRGRRMRASMLMAAAVLAVAVPTALVTVGDQDKEPTPAPSVEFDHSTITLAGQLEQGDAPRTGYAEGNTLHVDGRALTPTDDGRLVSFATFKAGLVVSTSDDQGNWTARVEGTDETWPMSGGFHASPDGDLVTFVQPDGTPIVIGENGTAHELPKIPEGTGFDAVGVLGPDCTLQAEYAGCGVVVSSGGEETRTWISWSSGEVSPAPAGVGDVNAVVDGERVASTTEVRDDLTTCSAVLPFSALIDDQGGKELWRTCDHSLLEFSPDGARLLATASYFDGEGMPQLTILDASTGDVVLDLPVTDEGVVPMMTWEDSEHVLAVVREGDQSAILRIGLDGTREYAVAPTGVDEDFMSPFRLPSL